MRPLRVCLFFGGGNEGLGAAVPVGERRGVLPALGSQHRRVANATVSSCLLCLGPSPQGAENLTTTLDLEVTQVSKGAIEAIEGKGGKIRTVYYGQTYLRYLLNPDRWAAKGRLPPKNPRPALKRIGYWLSWENRGYLAPEAQLDDIMAARAGHESASAGADADAGERA